MLVPIVGSRHLPPALVSYQGDGCGIFLRKASTRLPNSRVTTPKSRYEIVKVLFVYNKKFIILSEMQTI